MCLLVSILCLLTLAICRFEKLWETWGGKYGEKGLCVFKRILLIKFEMISNKLSLKKKKR